MIGFITSVLLLVAVGFGLAGAQQASAHQTTVSADGGTSVSVNQPGTDDTGWGG
ncbi:hypothetical protein [Streptomyces sp. NBC_01190]|uniref:hypothetical protein n=1 Tax=Streptomyces sp. NBC_01190 TaxID=2903767 RepID=UPI00386B77A1|nr:hypothetical protein OG519_24240 [Streptomyces sp. NBC_01190]